MRADLIAKLLSTATLEKAVEACRDRHTTPTFHGPAVVEGTQPGDILDHASVADGDDNESVVTATSLVTAASSSTRTQLADEVPPSTGKLYISSSPDIEGIYFGGDTSNAWRDNVLPMLKKAMLVPSVSRTYGYMTEDKILGMVKTVPLDGRAPGEKDIADQLYLRSAAQALGKSGITNIIFKGPSFFHGVAPGTSLNGTFYSPDTSEPEMYSVPHDADRRDRSLRGDRALRHRHGILHHRVLRASPQATLVRGHRREHLQARARGEPSTHQATNDQRGTWQRRKEASLLGRSPPSSNTRRRGRAQSTRFATGHIDHHATIHSYRRFVVGRS